MRQSTKPSASKPVERDQLMQVVRDALPELRRRYGVKSLWLFGSYARDTARTKSDVDLLVEFDRTPGLIGFNQLELHLSDLLGLKVDLVMKSALKPAIGKHILAEALPI